MKKLWVLPAVLLSCLVLGPTAAMGQAILQMAWMSGTWIADMEPISAIISEPIAGSMQGDLFFYNKVTPQIAALRTRVHATMTQDVDPASFAPSLTLRRDEDPPRRMVKNGPDEWIFEGTDDKSRGRYIIQRLGPNAMILRVQAYLGNDLLEFPYFLTRARTKIETGRLLLIASEQYDRLRSLKPADTEQVARVLGGYGRALADATTEEERAKYRIRLEVTRKHIQLQANLQK